MMLKWWWKVGFHSSWSICILVLIGVFLTESNLPDSSQKKIKLLASYSQQNRSQSIISPPYHNHTKDGITGSFTPAVSYIHSAPTSQRIAPILRVTDSTSSISDIPFTDTQQKSKSIDSLASAAVDTDVESLQPDTTAQVAQTDSLVAFVVPQQALFRSQAFELGVSGSASFKHQIQSDESVPLSYDEYTPFNERLGYAIQAGYHLKVSQLLSFTSSLGWVFIRQTSVLSLAARIPVPSLSLRQSDTSALIVPNHFDSRSVSSAHHLVFGGIGLRYHFRRRDKWFLGGEALIIKGERTQHAGVRLSGGKYVSLGHGWAVAIAPELTYFLKTYRGGFLGSNPYSLGLRLSIMKFRR